MWGVYRKVVSIVPQTARKICIRCRLKLLTCFKLWAQQFSGTLCRAAGHASGLSMLSEL